MAMSPEKRIKVLLAKAEIDHHDRGIRYVAHVLRDSGMEVVFIRYRMPEEIVQAALQEGVDVIGLSFYSSGAEYDTSVVMRMLKEQHMEDVQVIVGGVFPDEDSLSMREMGVKGVFRPGSPIAEVIHTITSGTR